MSFVHCFLLLFLLLVFALLADTDSVMCKAIYFVTRLFLTQLPDDQEVYETQSCQKFVLKSFCS